MSWNYRIFEKVDLTKPEVNKYYQIHEVYYNSEGNICAVDPKPAFPHGVDRVSDLLGSVENMMKAFHHPVLRMEELQFDAWDHEQEEGETEEGDDSDE